MDLSIEGLYTAWRHVQVGRISQVAATTILYLDYVLTFDQEVELIWKADWSAAKVMFLINRYYNLFSSIFNNYGHFHNGITQNVCVHWLAWQGWTGQVIVWISEIVLSMRVYMLWFKSKKILTIMVVGFIASGATSAYIMYRFIDIMKPIAMPIPRGTVCTPTVVPTQIHLFWLPMLLFEFLLCGLALIRALRTMQETRMTYSTGHRIVRVLFRDSVIYFLVLCAAYTACMLFWALGPVTLMQVPINFAVSFSCVLTSRLVLNVREAGKKDALFGISPQATTRAETQVSGVVLSEFSDRFPPIQGGVSQVMGSTRRAGETLAFERVQLVDLRASSSSGSNCKPTMSV